MTLLEAPWALLILALATYRISHFLVEDVLFAPIRDRIWRKYPPETTKVGYLFTCYWCTSIYGATLVVVLYLLIPVVAIPACAVLALSAVTGLIDHWRTK